MRKNNTRILGISRTRVEDVKGLNSTNSINNRFDSTVYTITINSDCGRDIGIVSTTILGNNNFFNTFILTNNESFVRVIHYRSVIDKNLVTSNNVVGILSLQYTKVCSFYGFVVVRNDCFTFDFRNTSGSTRSIGISVVKDQSIIDLIVCSSIFNSKSSYRCIFKFTDRFNFNINFRVKLNFREVIKELQRRFFQHFVRIISFCLTDKSVSVLIFNFKQ